MMQLITLAPIVNQAFSVVLDSIAYNFRLIQCNDVLCADIQRAGIQIVSGQRCLPGVFIFPYRYMEAGSGNFVFTSLNDELISYDKLGTTQNLFYISNADLVTYRG